MKKVNNFSNTFKNHMVKGYLEGIKVFSTMRKSLILKSLGKNIILGNIIKVSYHKEIIST